MAPHDFVHSAVITNVNKVVRDPAMIERPMFEGNMMYRRARELGSPIEQVMAVMLHVGDGLQSGLALYRDRRRPFSEREERTLQQLTPAIANAVGNCRSFDKMARFDAMLETDLAEKRAILIVRPPDREIIVLAPRQPCSTRGSLRWRAAPEACPACSSRS